MIMTPNVLDLYHGDNRDAVPNFTEIRDNGIWAIIHKASQGNAMTDKQYAPRRAAALADGLLWGAYHFMDASDPVVQAKHFLDVAQPDDNTLLACDFEKSSSTPSLHQAKDFMAYVDANAPGQVTCVLYSGDLIRESLRTNAGGHQAQGMAGAEMFFAQHRLWLAEYGPHANIPWPWSDKMLSQNWSSPFLWQYSEKGKINPILGNVDLNFYAGSLDDLKANWASLSSPTPNPAAIT
jgi:GH25 family lysozyme M1 (1,4-beta-N-acetylmuramidase)